ncbi:NLR family CARD domain-containing protein 4-like [Patiria miniata]|uniref:NACHT domain-containing protein n=1 Tax=Patiria miniata TaxID=46514 RepID=A0A913ZJ69_PATMI|nr:NLR family CARD domain-containing protein 4-like [Patiria miniata]
MDEREARQTTTSQEDATTTEEHRRIQVDVVTTDSQGGTTVPGTVPVAVVQQMLQHMQQISGSGNVPTINPTGYTVTINTSRDNPDQSGQPSVNINVSEKPPSTSQYPPADQSANPPSSSQHPPADQSANPPSSSQHPPADQSENPPSTSQYPPADQSENPQSTPQHPPADQSENPQSTPQHPPADKSENPQSTPQQPTTQQTASQTQEHSSSKKVKFDSPGQDAADSCEKSLRSLYMTTGSYVQLLPWVGDDMKHILDIFTKLQLKTGKGENEFMLASYEDIILLLSRAYHLNPIAILTGLAGSGKTTLFDKIAYDWAVGSSRVLQRYKLVFKLKMHSLDETSGHVTAVFNQLLAEDTCVDKGRLDTFIKHSPMKVLILLDGFDEFKTTSLCESKFGSILNILNRMTLRGCTVLVSTRPSHYDRLVSWDLVQEPFTHVEVLGFNNKSVPEYVNKFFSHEPDKAKGLIDRIKSSDLLSGMAESPLLLLALCLLWRDDGTLVETVSSLFHKGVAFIFKRKEDVSEEEVSRVLVDIGKISLQGVLAPGQLLSFKQSDFKAGVLDMALKAGILTRQRVLGKPATHDSLEFIYNEFSAAMYWQSLLEEHKEKFRKILNQVVSEGPKKFEYLLRFCCRENEACTNVILKALHGSCREKWSLKSEMGRLALHCFCEGQSERLPPDVLIHSFIADQIIIEGLDSDGLESFTYFLKCLAGQPIKKKSGSTHLAKVNKLVVLQCNLTWCAMNLAPTMSSMTNLRSVGLYGCSLTGKHFAKIAESLKDLAKLVELDLSGNDLGGTAESWCKQVKQLKALTKLVLVGCSLNGQDIKHVVEPLKDRPKRAVHEWDVSGYNLGGSADSWCMDAKHWRTLTKMGWGGRSRHGRDMRHGPEPLRDLPNLVLVELDISNNNLGGTAESWCKQVKHWKALKKLGLGGCSLNGEDVKHVAESLKDQRNLVELDLSRNDLGGTTETWCMEVKQLRTLTKLFLGDCSLNGQDIKHVAESLGDLPNFVELDLSNNNLGGTAE